MSTLDTPGETSRDAGPEPSPPTRPDPVAEAVPGAQPHTEPGTEPGTEPDAQPDLRTELRHAHDNALAGLDDPSENTFAAVTWAAAHLAAVDRVLYPAVCAALPDGRQRVREQTAVDRRLQLALWELDRRLTGDVHLRRPVATLEAGVRRALQAHVEGERALVDDLLAALSPEQQRDLVTRLATALLRSPTRPHPDTRHGLLGAGLTFWFGGVVDRMRDSLDSRIVPTPHRTSVPRPMTRWGAYALGQPPERAPEDGR